MASVNTTSIREEIAQVEQELARLSEEGKVSNDSRVFFSTLLMIVNMLVIIFIDKSTGKSCRNSSIPRSQTEQDQSSTTAKVPLLIIDDYGLKPLRPEQDEDLHDPVADRYEQTATIITSDLDFVEWGESFLNKLLGADTLDRLRHRAYQLVLDGKSYRSPRPSSGGDKSAFEKGPENAK